MEAEKVDSLFDRLGIPQRGRMRRGAEFNFSCPFHDDRKSSASLNLLLNVWLCSANCGSGPIPNLIQRVLKISGREADQIYETFGGSVLGWDDLRALTDGKKPVVKRTWLSEIQLEALPIDSVYYPTRGFSDKILAAYGIRWFERHKCAIHPYHDAAGKYVAHTVRFNIQGSFRHNKPKGLTPSEHLFGLPVTSWDKKAQKFRGKELYLAEGPASAMMLHQLGVKDVVGLFGSKVSDEQRALVCRARKVIAALDADWAGIRGLWSISKKIGRSASLYYLEYPEELWGRDPAELSSRDLDSCVVRPLLPGWLTAWATRIKNYCQDV